MLNPETYKCNTSIFELSTRLLRSLVTLGQVWYLDFSCELASPYLPLFPFCLSGNYRGASLIYYLRYEDVSIPMPFVLVFQQGTGLIQVLLLSH